MAVSTFFKFISGEYVNQDQASRFKAILAPHLADALAFARWITRDRADAEDVVQEACIRAFRALDRFSGPNGRAWLLTIVRNTAFTWLREKKGAAMVSLEELSERDRQIVDGVGELENGATPESAVIALGEAMQINEVIAALPVEFREVLVLRDVQGLEYREIAEVTGLPLGTVMSRLARARQKLIAQIRQQER